MKFCASLLACLVLAAPHAAAQMVFAAPADFGGTTGIGLFASQNGQTTRLNTGFPEHRFPWLSRGGVISFYSPDPVVNQNVPPSSDIYVFNPATGVTTKVINHTTGVSQTGFTSANLPASSAVSPNGQLIAYGVAIQQNMGIGNSQTTKELNIADVGTGVILANPTAGRGPTEDPFGAEFSGLSWDPGGNSFVTPTYVLVGTFGGFPQNLPAILRYTRQQNGSYAPAQLSTPQFVNAATARYHIYPAISPSGAGLAYFSILMPDAITNSQPAEATLVRANADGSNAQALFTFNPGFYPVGLDWSADGTRLVFSLAEQQFFNNAYQTLVRAETADAYSLSSSDGSDFREIPGTAGALFVSVGSLPSSGPSGDIRLALSRNGPDNFTLTATGVDPGATYQLRSTTTLEDGSFGAPQAFTGAQLQSGINIPRDSARRFFQLFEP